MIRRARQQPNERISEKVSLKEDPRSNLWEEEIQAPCQNKEWDGIGNEVVDAAMHHWGSYNAQESVDRAGIDAQEAQVILKGHLQVEEQPHDEAEADRYKIGRFGHGLVRNKKTPKNSEVLV